MSAIATSDRARTAIELGESHFREFKSALEGEPGKKKKRPIKDISTNIAQTLVAFANADGGELLVGVEDSGEISGLEGFSEADIELLKEACITRVHKDTPLPTVRKTLLTLDNRNILYFSVSKSLEYVHVTSDGRCLQRRDLESVPVSSEAVRFDRREIQSREYDRKFVDGVSADDLDLKLVRIVADQVLKGMSIEKCLQYLELGEYGLSQLKLRKAALLLFAKVPSKWHPRVQIRILRVDGDELETGENYNAVFDDTINGNIITLIEDAWEALRPHLVHTKFDKSARFEQKSIYPELACKEALLNAIAHRDYSEEGRGIEVFIYSNRLEIKNPGSLLTSIRLEDIVNQKGAHQSRNTYVARVLRELGYMRELGEGMRRIYELMHHNELAPPVLNSSPDGFNITLTHRPFYSSKDLLWLGQFEQFDLDREQKSVILLGQEARIFSAQDIWDAVGIVDTEHYRKLTSSLNRINILKSSIDKEEARRQAFRNKTPIKQFPRFEISLPKIGNTLVKAHKSIESTNPEKGITSASVHTLFVSNIPYDITKSEIFDVMSSFGSVANIRFPVFKEKSKGYCFVEFESAIAAEKVLSSEVPIKIKESSLVIRIATPRKPS